ncbi:hypothetical protein NDA11_007704 [Ustilago hordei]|uniref:DUF2461 domain-containing protein n=1 Tax=Ustilago hordei TaxID=120017 RepID=I2FUW3_USTHO|nr:uncharacterized protein UHO2_06607 [Ustilago hordei]KAJ1040739.1 hypothetical protein NDA10_008020 [Ustilago hordei]KAJ1596555.1 hypothetical protein NDA11_007704 [Ustilago hordei]CCF50706.1 uncharacterized protein UHOR_06258 [Ustilago hordei]SYW77310.1 uncharacterized protein UHO2_06607 [Ustilago hordei]
MSSRRSARVSTGKRLSYREESDQENAVHHLTEDEYQAGDRGSTSADEVLKDGSSGDPSEEEEQRDRPAKRRKKNTSTPSKRAAPTSIKGDECQPGVTRVVAKLVGPPQSGHVARGELSPNVLKFLSDLQANNERHWFARHDAVYRYCSKNFAEFTEAVLNDFMEKVDSTLPWLPTKDIAYRIYRDVRFSNDKTPYKTNLMASFSRGGRKGPFAGYHLLIKPGGRSFIAAGRWQPEREDLAVIRQHILHDTPEAQALKAAVRETAFTKWFGAPKGETSKTEPRTKKGAREQQRCNLWGGDDQLKVAPKIAGVDKMHKDIDWLKLRSFCVIHNFSDAEVLRKDFRQRLVEVAKVSEPLVRILNSMTSPDPPSPPGSDHDGADADGADGGGGGDDDEGFVATESFDYVDDDDNDDDNDNDNDDNDDDDNDNSSADEDGYGGYE